MDNSVVVARPQTARKLVLLFHGVGSSAANLVPLAQLIANRLVARDATAAVAYTWGDQEPTDNGTAHTWRALAHVPHTHVGLQELVDAHDEPQEFLAGPRN